MAATDARAVPIKNAAFRVTFPVLDADGDLVTGATGLDSEVSIDGGAFADATAEATEIATASGMYYLDLTAAEMNGDTIAIIVKTTSAGAKTTPIVLYTAARSINDLAWPTTTGRSIDVAATGEVGLDYANTAGTIGAANLATGAITAAKFAAGAIDAAAIATDAIDADAIATDAFCALELAAGAATEIADAVWNTAMVEPTVVPAVTAQARGALAWLLALTRNKMTQTSTTTLLRNDADAATIATSTVSDDGTTFTRGEMT